MFKSFQVAGSAAFALLSMSLLLANGVSSAASAQVSSFEAPAVVAPDAATPVELSVSKSSIEGAPDAAAPAEDFSDSLAELVGTWQDDGSFDADEKCLATAIFFESKGESLEGQLAVANVVLARTESGRFAKTVCGVITQRGQFGFVRNGRMPNIPEDSNQWRTAKAIAQIAMNGSWKNPVEGALYFHATYSSAEWDRPQVAKIGRHIFYR